MDSPSRQGSSYNKYEVNNGSPLRSSPSQAKTRLRPEVSELRASQLTSSAGKDREADKGLDKVEQGEVAKIFKDSIFLERELESAKIEVALKPDFNLMDLFRMLDPSQKGYFN